MPAVVSSTDGSWTDGTSDAEGSRRCSRSSKNDRNRSRISAAFMALESRRAGIAVCRRRLPAVSAATSGRIRPEACAAGWSFAHAKVCIARAASLAAPRHLDDEAADAGRAASRRGARAPCPPMPPREAIVRDVSAAAFLRRRRARSPTCCPRRARGVRAAGPRAGRRLRARLARPLRVRRHLRRAGAAALRADAGARAAAARAADGRRRRRARRCSRLRPRHVALGPDDHHRRRLLVLRRPGPRPRRVRPGARRRSTSPGATSWPTWRRSPATSPGPCSATG